MAKKKAVTKTLRPKAAKKAKHRPAATVRPDRVNAKPKAAMPSPLDESQEPKGEKPAAVFGRKFIRLARAAGIKTIVALIAKAGHKVGETTIYGICRGNLKSHPKASTVKILDTALAADKKLLECFGDCVGRAVVEGSWS